MRDINIGKFRNRIDILKHKKKQDDYGELIDTWDVHKTVWASKQPILGNEFFTALTTNTKVDVKFNTRYIKNIDNSMRIKHNSEVYDIESVIDIESLHNELLFYCRLVK